MIDMHTHIIPNVDDGSKTIEDSLRMLKEEVEQGVDTIILTPHHTHGVFVCPKDKLLEGKALLDNLIKENNLPLTLYMGNEIHYSDTIDFVPYILKGELFTLADSNKVLLEFSYTRRPLEPISEIIYHYRCNNLQVVIAHVERYKWMTIKDIKEAVAEGALIQVNANAVNGLEGLKSSLYTHKLIRQGLVNYIASDVHSFRKNTLKKAMDKFGKYLNTIDLI